MGIVFIISFLILLAMFVGGGFLHLLGVLSLLIVLLIKGVGSMF